MLLRPKAVRPKSPSAVDCASKLEPGVYVETKNKACRIILHRDGRATPKGSDFDIDAAIEQFWLARHGVAKAVQSAIAEIAFQVAARAGE